LANTPFSFNISLLLNIPLAPREPPCRRPWHPSPRPWASPPLL
jgi:hypothetical protein